MIFFRVSEFVLQAEGEHVVLQVGGETVECRARLVAHDVVVGSELQPFHNVPCGAEADGPSQCVGDARPARAERIARYFRIGVVDVVFGYQREGRILDVVGEKDVTAPERTQVSDAGSAAVLGLLLEVCVPGCVPKRYSPRSVVVPRSVSNRKHASKP